MESTDSSSGTQQPQLPPGFRFHPTDEELVIHYLKKKVASAPLPVAIIAEVDLYKFDPWELPAKATFGEQEWYFFSPRDRKYPNGARPNRAATSGYWKATGTDKPVLTAGGTQKVGVKKALVFYGGKPPKGVKTNWIMHEYRLAENKANAKPPGCDVVPNKKRSLRLDDWVLCRIYKKSNSLQRPMDRERVDDIHDMLGSMRPTLSMSVQKLRPGLQPCANYGSLLSESDHHHNFYQGMMANDSIACHQLGSKVAPPPQLPLLAPPDPNNLLSEKRPLPGLFWNEEPETGNSNSPPTKRFLAEGCCDGRTATGEMTNNSIVTILQQQQQQGQPIGLGDDGIFRQAQPYQVSGMNWYT